MSVPRVGALRSADEPDEAEWGPPGPVDCRPAWVIWRALLGLGESGGRCGAGVATGWDVRYEEALGVGEEGEDTLGVGEEGDEGEESAVRQ
ncbi:hypothetical protein GCM10010172_27750 [Paractinoplanes ferrugineus]|uniref:Uncharacterized protein n=1 Tax=Paractinoplanes ferrugineus TaxID=113564 RepID=A0A919ITN5_9ACTN|nr:hypothetical protein Afe05nite_01550 [Actinoplanes ferrugineus]